MISAKKMVCNNSNKIFQQTSTAKDEQKVSEFTNQIKELETLFSKSLDHILGQPSIEKIEPFRIEWMGRKGHITSLYQKLKTVDASQRAEVGKLINALKKRVEGEISSLKSKSLEYSIEQSLANYQVDVTLPASRVAAMGSLHPVTLMRKILLKEFRRLGFSVWDGPEIDSDFYNFLL